MGEEGFVVRTEDDAEVRYVANELVRGVARIDEALQFWGQIPGLYEILSYTISIRDNETVVEPKRYMVYLGYLFL